MAANAGFAILEFTEASVMFYSAAASSAYYRNGRAPSTFYNALMVSSAGAALLTLAGQAVFNIWNICDAVNVAKVKDLFYRDAALASSSRLDMSFAPTLAVVPAADGSACPAAGVGVRFTF